MRITKLEKEKRVLTVQQWIIEGVQEDLMRKQMRQEWGISTRQAKRYIKDAYESWKTDAEIDIDTKRQAKIAELQQLKRSLKAEYKGTPSGIRAQMAVEKQIIRLEPYSVQRIDITSGGEPIQEMTPEEREARIKELLKKRNANKTRKKNANRK